ncbi:MAG TPA: DUF362 domain-containing protein [Spirochaetota bacterium]|nr:DUF362 domain-containing protein [Spirochaetota bacterium]
MKAKVFFIPSAGKADDAAACGALRKLIAAESLLGFIAEKDMVAVKTHFGEGKKTGHVPPLYLKMLGELVREMKGSPFLTETQTLYKGNRTDAVSHLNHAQAQGYGYERTGMPIIMADGLYGDEEVEVPVPGKIYSSVKLASGIVKASSLVMVSHFTGHLATGFGCALKNMGMGCSSRRGKMIQHSTAKPRIKAKACTKCGLCVRWCPAGAITMEEKSAVINSAKCIGCGQCLAVCRFDAVAYNWGATYEDLQKKVVEHAWGVARGKENKMVCVNFLTRISKDCDCMDVFEQIVPDIGIVVSRDPVAADAASLALVEQRAGKKLSDVAYEIPYRFQIDYAREIGFGNPDYELMTVD